MASAPLSFDPALAAFVCGGVSISLASSRSGAFPNMARGVGCRPVPGEAALAVFVAATPGAALLEDVRRNGRVATVFSEPRSHRTLQFKGSDARIEELEAGDFDRIRRYIEAFVGEVAALGYPSEIVGTLLECDLEDVVALRFTISAGFSQTPGPRAGEPLTPSP